MTDFTKQNSDEGSSAARSRKDAMTTNDTKALVSELREVRAKIRENTSLLRVLVKQTKKPTFKWPPS